MAFGEISIEIGGKVRTMKFNLNADFEHCKMLKMTLNQLLEYRADQLNVTNIRERIYCALKVVDLQSGNPIDYDQYTVGEWLSDLKEADIMAIFEAMGTANVQEQVKKKAGKADA